MEFEINWAYLAGRIRQKLGIPTVEEDLVFRRHFARSSRSASLFFVRVILEEKAAAFLTAIRVYGARRYGFETAWRANNRRGLALRLDEGMSEYELRKLLRKAELLFAEFHESCLIAHHFYPDAIPEDACAYGEVLSHLPKFRERFRKGVELLRGEKAKKVS